ncbi:MAG: nuclear transport factor 2 family protein [bacterium]|nr:nuclear transport factor 2 family protein [bacterium]
MRIHCLPALVCLLIFPLVEELSAQTSDQLFRESLPKYFESWQEEDVEKRGKLLESAWSEKGTYTDPTAHVVGRKALVEHIGGFLSNPQFQGVEFIQASGIDVHHGVFRFQWKMVDATGQEIMTGMDYGEFDERGRITKIVGFFGPFPELK